MKQLIIAVIVSIFTGKNGFDTLTRAGIITTGLWGIGFSLVGVNFNSAELEALQKFYFHSLLFCTLFVTLLTLSAIWLKRRYPNCRIDRF